MSGRGRILLAAITFLDAGCQPPAPATLVSLQSGAAAVFVQDPPGARLTFTIEGETAIAGEPHVQVHVALEDAGEVRDAGHLYVRQTHEGLYWRITDSAHTLLTPGFFQYPARDGDVYVFGDAQYRVSVERISVGESAIEAVVYEQTKESVEPLRVAFVPGLGPVALESGAFRFERVAFE